MTFIDEQTDHTQPLDLKGFGHIEHVFEIDDIRAINAALAAQRPLLLKGEPGVGKTQLAKAAAQALSRPLIQYVVDARSESRDLLWQVDAVQRLADAQILAATETDLDCAKQQLSMDHYLQPGPLWWALNWDSAKRKNHNQEPENCWVGKPIGKVNGCIVLIDEIDKAEPEVPNGLLEVLGDYQFRVPVGKGITVQLDGCAPLVLVTSNQERELPDAFLRRCFVHHLKLPNDPAALREKLMERGRAHCAENLSETIYQQAAGLLIRERQRCEQARLQPLPGQAEYLDILRATEALVRSGVDAERALEQVARFAVHKHTEDDRS